MTWIRAQLSKLSPNSTVTQFRAPGLLRLICRAKPKAATFAQSRPLAEKTAFKRNSVVAVISFFLSWASQLAWCQSALVFQTDFGLEEPAVASMKALPMASRQT